MKKYTIIFLIGIMSFYNAKAKVKENWITAVIKNGEQTYSVLFNINGTSKYSLQFGLTYKDENGKKIKLRPEDASEFQFEWEGKTFRMISVPQYYNKLSYSPQKPLFLELVQDGRIQLFNWYTSFHTHGKTTTDANGTQKYNFGNDITYQNLVLYKDEIKEQMYCPNIFTFKKRMIIYLEDCPSVVSKVEQNKLKISDLEEIIIEYNSNCGQEEK